MNAPFPPASTPAPPATRETALTLAVRAARIRWAKLVLPIIAGVLLSLIALWPEASRIISRARLNFAGMVPREVNYGTMRAPRFRGLDQNNQAFVVTADTATRRGNARVDLAHPAADLSLRNGNWLMVTAPTGVYAQGEQQLDLDGWVTLYRDDGTLLQTRNATIDVRQGAATSATQTDAEGPFGTLQAQGFTLTGKGALVQFHGPAKLVIHATH